MQETTILQQNEGNKVATTFKCSHSVRSQLLTKAAQLGITLSALCEDYVLAGLNGAVTDPAAPTEKPDRTLTDIDLKLIQSEVEQAILNTEAAAQGEDTPEAEAPEATTQDDSAAPVLALKLTPGQRQVIDRVNEYRKDKKTPALEDSAAEILNHYAQDVYDRGRFEKTNGMSLNAFKKAWNAQDDKPVKAA
jgi:hypothetical protein